MMLDQSNMMRDLHYNRKHLFKPFAYLRVQISVRDNRQRQEADVDQNMTSHASFYF